MIFFEHLSAVLIGYFGLRIICRQLFVPKVMMTKIVSIFFVIQWMIIYFLKKNILIFLANIAVIGVLFLYYFLKQRWHKSQFRKGFPEFLTAIILQMKVGKSFRVSFQNAVQNLPTYQKEIFDDIYQNVTFLPQEKDKKIAAKGSFNDVLFDEFLKIDRSKHKTVEKIENFRSRLINENNFRRRSGRIRENVYVQVSIMAFFYVSSFVYVMMTMSFQKVQDILVASLTLFVLGTVLSFFLGRKIKWSI